MNINKFGFNSPNSSLYLQACRTCLKQLEEDCDQKSIWEADIHNKIESLTSRNLHTGNGLSDFICYICYEKLIKAAEFKEQILKVNDILNKYSSNLPEAPQVAIRGYTPFKEDEKPWHKAWKRKKDSKEKDLIHIEEKEESTYNSSGEGELDTSVLNISDFGEISNATVRKQKRNIDCPTCGKKFTTQCSLKIHLRTHGILEKNIKCDNCGKKYSNQYDLRVHLRKHSGIRPFTCGDCEKTFADQRCFEKHKKIHSGEKLFKCEQCDKSFIHAYTLKTHLRVHSGEKPFVCAKCGHSFTTTTQLKLHTRIHHTREKPYSCESCPKVFASSSGLSNHKMTHTGERKFICSVCGKGSRTTSDLKCHLRTHTGERPFKCTIPRCDKKYKTNSQLCAHIRSHTGEQNRKCVKTKGAVIE